MNYRDPKNRDDIISRFEKLSDKKEIQEFIEEIFPGWLQVAVDRYSYDYDYLQRNWRKICQMTNTTPKKIVLVSDIHFDEDHKLLQEFCEVMTKHGYCVRRAAEFKICEKCYSAIPDEDVWKLMRGNGMPVPRRWSNRCRDCEDSDDEKS